MVTKALTLLSLALATVASPIQTVNDHSLVHAVVDASSTTSGYVTIVRRQEDAAAVEPAPKKSSKGKAKSKGKASSAKGSGSEDTSAPPNPKSSSEESSSEAIPAPKEPSSGSSKGSGLAKGTGSSPKSTGASPKGTGASPKGTSSSSSSSSGGGGLLDALPFGTSLSSMGMMSSSDLKKGNYECKKIALLFARGTGEPGNMGFVVGPPLGTQLKKQYGSDILIQGMDYSTDFSGSGAKEMAKYAKDLLAKCPETKIVLSGYSQGAMQVHQALGSLGPDASKIAAAVTFGDPYSTMGWGSGGIVGAVMGLGSGSLTSGSKSAGGNSGNSGAKPASTSGGSFDGNNGLILCSTGDFVCGVVPSLGAGGGKSETGGKGGMGHISYSSDGSIGKAAAFIAKKIGGS